MGATGAGASIAHACGVCTLLLLATGCSERSGGDREPRTVDFAAGDPVENSLSAVAAGSGNPRTRRAAAPTNTGPVVRSEDYPWQVGILVTPGGAVPAWRCGGILVSPDFVLTAAHCLDVARADDYDIIRRATPAMIGIFHGDRRFRQGARLAIHPDWGLRIHPRWKVDRDRPFAYDVALIRLREPVPASVTTAPLRIPAIGQGLAVVSGWGSSDATDIPSSELRAVRLPIIDNATCANHLPPEARRYVSTTVLCTESGTDDACGGDSGGPLVVGSRRRPQTVGVVSWGPSAHCTYRGPNGTMMGGYARASSIVDWVLSATSDQRAATSAEPDPLFPVTPASQAESRQ